MIYELRVYHCLPGRLPALLKRFETVTVRLQWDSMAERDKRFAAFQSDPERIEARRKSEEDGPLVASISNSILAPTAFSAAR
jgi:hypothetical protein